MDFMKHSLLAVCSLADFQMGKKAGRKEPIWQFGVSKYPVMTNYSNENVRQKSDQCNDWLKFW